MKKIFLTVLAVTFATALSHLPASAEDHEGSRSDARQDGRAGKQDARSDAREGRQDARGEGRS